MHILDELATHTPERIWLSKVTVHDGRQMLMEGMSLDNELVALFLTALERVARTSTDVELDETEAKEMGGLRLNALRGRAR